MRVRNMQGYQEYLLLFTLFIGVSYAQTITGSFNATADIVISHIDYTASSNDVQLVISICNFSN
jgi:hypothetical protein